MQHLLIKITSLKLSEDTELNSEQYEIAKSVQGNFSQGKVPLLGELQLDRVLAIR